MIYLKPILLFILAASTTACASKTKYYFDIAAVGETYEETYGGSLSQVLTVVEGANVTTLEGDDRGALASGPGLRVGFTEEINERVVTRISYYYADLGDINYRFNIQGTGDYTQVMALSNSGLDISIGVNIWAIRPSIVVKSVKGKVESQKSGVRTGSETTEETVSFIGFGLATDFDVGKSSKLYLEYQLLEDRSAQINNSGADISNLNLGLRYPLN